MRKFSLLIIVLIGFTACRNNAPNVSNVDISLEVQRFEQDFFAIDTNQIGAGLAALQKKYPIFLSDFTHNILGLPAFSDTSTQVLAAVKQFMNDYRPLKDSADKIFEDFAEQTEAVSEGLRYTKHYFPNYPVPQKLITFIGPMDAYFEASMGGYGDVITADALAIGLQLHLGSNFSLYKTEMGQSLYPLYISRKFAPEYIAVNSMKNVIDDLFPDNSSSRTLVEQMVEKGKRMYVLDKLLPNTADTLKIGYTSSQLEGCYSNEGLIWNYFLKNGMLYNNDLGVIKNYIGDSPNTPEFGEGAPGYIGLFTGWQIVKAYMDKNEAMKMEDLMLADPKVIFEESKYRPK